MKITVYIATSLDGFIARENGRLDWLPNSAETTEDYGYSAFINTVDLIIMGRNTFETVLGFEGDWPYAGKQVVVLSHRLSAHHTTLPTGVSILSGDPAHIVRRLQREETQHIYLDGGQTIQAFLQAGLVDELILTRVPRLIGSGIPLFGSLPHDVQWTHLKTAVFPNGLVQSHYRIRR